MKIFTFCPKTGKKGTQIANVPRATYGGPRLEGLECKVPERRSEHWTLRADGGTDKQSYVCDRWICYCTGREDDVWVWDILPPKDLIP